MPQKPNRGSSGAKGSEGRTLLAKSAQDFDAPRHDDLTWGSANRANLFYAAAFLSEGTNPKRSWKERLLDDEKSESTRGLFLDQIALLFARAKTIKSSSYPQDPCPSEAGENVTAIAWGKHYIQNQQQYVPIYVAKNNGPQSFDDRSDVQFAAELEAWYNKLSPDSLAEDAFQDPMWVSMQNFWLRRHRFYTDEIRTIHRRWRLTYKIELGKDEPTTEFLRGLYDVNDCQNKQPFPKLLAGEDAEACQVRHELPEMQAFRDDWHRVGVLLGLLYELGESIQDDDVLNGYVKHICSNDGIWRQTYSKPTPERRKKYKLQDDFRKIVKYLKMLKTLSSVWNACILLKRQVPAVKLSFRFLLRQEMTPIPVKPLQDLLKSWKDRITEQHSKEPAESNSDGKSIQSSQASLVEQLEGTKKRFYNMKSIPRMFHCELQLLLVPNGVHYLPVAECETSPRNGPPKFKYDKTKNEAIFTYIGCSKYSCYLCWKILCSLSYSTKNTHSQLHCGCAIPIHTLSLPRRFYGTWEARLFKISTRLEKKILNDKFSTTVDLMTQTATTPDRLLGPIGSVSIAMESEDLFAWEPEITPSNRAVIEPGLSGL
jgi:OTT_1508-like deaminase